jgi:hypothetical protein
MMKDSTSRSLRTLLWGLVALLPSIPAAVAALNLPAGKAAQLGAMVVAVAAAVTKLVNLLEELGVLKPVLAKQQ